MCATLFGIGSFYVLRAQGEARFSMITLSKTIKVHIQNMVVK